MTTEEKANKIIEDIRKEQGTNPIRMFKNLAGKDYISIHGPEHHILDGACLLMAYHNAGGKINGPRCCKRDAMIAFKHGIEYVNQHYGVHLEYEKQTCEFSSQNQQCVKDRCPFFN